MARHRVIFVAGLGNYLPGQLSSPAQAASFVAGVASLGNPVSAATVAQSGSLINPAVGLGSQIATAALLKNAGSLGIPQNLQNFISASLNTGGLFVELLLNPQRIKEEQQKIITKQPTANGYAYFHWGLEPKKITFEIITKSLRPKISDNGVSASDAQSNLDQMEKFFQVNNFNVGLIYQNKIYVGHFEGVFMKTRDVNNPNITSASFTFIVDKIPSVMVPGFGSFNINTIPFNV